MMPDHTADRHASRNHDCSTNSSTAAVTSSCGGRRFELITERDAQEIGTTTSRQLRRADAFLAAARYMVRYHPKAGATTIRLATAFAARMHRSRYGHVAFNLDATVRKLGLSRRTVLNHARYLRELGLIAWVEHGSKRNVLRTRRGGVFGPGDGYRGTATIYAPVAPPAWDHVQGHRIRGAGYRARLIGYTDKGRDRAVAAARSRARQARRIRTTPRKRCTPSLVVTSAPSLLQVDTGEMKNTRRVYKQTDACCTSRSPITPGECRQAIALAEQVQREVWWLYNACSRRIAYALRLLIAAGWTAVQLAAELATWGVPAHLQDPAAYVHHEAGRRQRLGELKPAPAGPSTAPRGDDGARYEAMLRDRARSIPAWQRYVQLARPRLRADLANQRERRRAQAAGAPVYRPVLREPEEAFFASLPADSWVDAPTPREIYAARAQRRTAGRGRVLSATDDAWQEHLCDHVAAAQACARLHARWERESADVPDGAVVGGPDDDPCWRDVRE
ncbi:hypothetical protein [Streptomyces sp. NPDC005732]|uniref:hypothetical protein n=1 Tax=Streptomyces sp. NPDC005732 TaxID=3157057 RepID=UPI0033E45FA5